MPAELLSPGDQRSRTADEPTGQKNEYPANNHLKRRLKEGRVHVLVADEANHAKLNRHNDDRDGSCEAELRNKKWKRAVSIRVRPAERAT